MEPLRVITRRTFLTTAGLAAAAVLAARSLRGAAAAPAGARRGPLHADTLAVEPLGDGLVLTPPGTAVSTVGRNAGAAPVFRLNGPAAFVWRAADGTRTPDEIAAQLAAAYSIPLERARRDSARCLATLSRAGLVTTARG